MFINSIESSYNSFNQIHTEKTLHRLGHQRFIGKGNILDMNMAGGVGRLELRSEVSLL